MSQDNKEVSYEKIFGEIDFQEGQEARSVLSPAAYLADLLQLYEDEFDEDDIVDTDNDNALLKGRREDITEIPLDEENTFSMIPYLDIVNEILEKRVAGLSDTEIKDKKKIIIESYNKLKEAKHPINLPFDLDNERIKKYLKYLDVTPEKLYKLFGMMQDSDLDASNEMIAREYLGLSMQEYTLITQDGNINELYPMTAEDIALEETIGQDITVDNLTTKNKHVLLSNVKVFMRKANITFLELLELLQQNLHEKHENLAKAFYINKTVGGYARLDKLKNEKIEFIKDGNVVEIEGGAKENWFIRAYKFISLAKKIGMSLTDLDVILRSCCDNNLNQEAIKRIALVDKLHKTYELPIDVVCSFFSHMNVLGTGKDEEPIDLFNRIYNGTITTIDKKYMEAYIHGNQPNHSDHSNSSNHPTYTSDNGYNPLKPVDVDDIMSVDNKLYTMRICKALKITREELEFIVDRFNEKLGTGVVCFTSLSGLSLLYRVVTLSEVLEITIQDLFHIFDILGDDPLIRCHHSFDVLFNMKSVEKNCYKIIEGNDMNGSIWLNQLVIAIARWMQDNDLTAEELKKITSREVSYNPEDEEIDHESEEYLAFKAEKAAKIDFLNNLYKQFNPIMFSEDIFISDTRHKRESRAIFRQLVRQDQVVSGEDSRLLLCSKEQDIKEVRRAVYQAVNELDKLHKEDFTDTGIEERIITKIMDNLHYRGYMTTKGDINEQTFPGDVADFYMTTDFEDYKSKVFDIIIGLYEESLQEQSGEDVQMSLYPSDLQSLGLPEGALKELYDNLIFNHYIDEDESVLDPAFFSMKENVSRFRVNADIEDYSCDIYQLITDNMKKFESKDIILDRRIFGNMGLTELEVDHLISNLWFNSYIDEDDIIVDKKLILATQVDDFNLAMTFYPSRHKILEVIKKHILEYKSHFYNVSRAMLEDIAGLIVASDIYKVMEANYLREGVISRESRAFFRDKTKVEEFDLGDYFTNNEENIVFKHISKIVGTLDRYMLKQSTLSDMGLEDWESEHLIEALEDDGYIYNYKLYEEEIEYFLDVNNALDFKVERFDDYNKDIFFALHDMAKEVNQEIEELSKQIMELAKTQEMTLLDSLKDVYGIDSDIIRSVGSKMYLDADSIVEQFMIPVLDTVDVNDAIVREPDDNTFNYAYRRMKQIALLISRLRLSKDETEVVFAEQNLVQKFPEKLILPEGLDTFDVVLEGIDDKIYLFAGNTYYVYSSQDYRLLRNLDETFALIQEEDEENELYQGLTVIDYFYYEYSDKGTNKFQINAAFVDQSEAIHVITDKHYYYKEKDKELWETKEREWGLVESNFEGITKIDASFVDNEGKTYLFSKDQYMRYSKDAFTGGSVPAMDEGYPKNIDDGWKDEFQEGELHEDFQKSIDASFEGIDHRNYMFKDDKYICSDDYTTSYWTNNKFGKVKNNFDTNQKIDAAIALDDKYYIFSEDQVICYRNNIENSALSVEEGFPMTLDSFIPTLPFAYKKGIDAIAKKSGTLFMFKDGKCVRIVGDQDGNYTAVQEVNTEELWGIVKNNIVTQEKVDAAFVGLDGKAYIFSGDQYYRYSYEDYSKVDPGYPRLITSDWGSLKQVNAAFVLDEKTYLCGMTSDGTMKYVCYSTNDYTKIDEDYPKDIEDNWWNLPFSLTKTDVPDTMFGEIDAIYTDQDNRTYLFHGNRFITFDKIHRWWSEPQLLSETWGDMPFGTVDAAFTGKDGKTYIFSGKEYLRYSTSNPSKVDDGSPNNIKDYWGNIANNIIDTGKVDACLTVNFTEEDEQYLYLFSGNQYYRYTLTSGEEGYVDEGYPQDIHKKLKEEPGFENLNLAIESGIDAAFANRRNIYLFKDSTCHIVVESISESLDRVYQIGNDKQVNCVFMDEGSIYARRESNNRWYRCSDVDGGRALSLTETMPPLLRNLHTDIDDATGQGNRLLSTILQGMDGNTYAFYRYMSEGIADYTNGHEANKHHTCYNYLMDKEYSIAEEWGRVDNHIVNNSSVDAAFVGIDGKTYMFSGHQYVIYNHEESNTYQFIDEVPKSIMQDFGLKNVGIAYVKDDITYLFEKPDARGRFRYTQYSGDDYTQSDEGFPKTINISWWGIPMQYMLDGFNQVNAVYVEGENTYLINGDMYIQYNHEEDIWSSPKQVDRMWRDMPLKSIKTLFRGVDGSLYFFQDHSYAKLHDGFFQDINIDPRTGENRYTDTCVEGIDKYWGKVDNNIVQNNRIDAAFVHNNETTYLFSGDQYVRYTTSDYRYVDEGYPKRIFENLRFEEGFGDLDHAFGLTDDSYSGEVIVKAIIANKGSIYIYTEGMCIALAQSAMRQMDIWNLGHVRNNIITGSVDAAFGNDKKTYILSGDQYIRYSDRTYEYVDEGYPKSITALVNEGLGIEQDSFTTKFTYDMDAAFMKGNDLYLFKGDKYFHHNTEMAISDTWGKIKNEFSPSNQDSDDMVKIDAAFLDSNDTLYVFKGSQYIRYSDMDNNYVDEGYPKDIRNNWGNLPIDFEESINAAFTFDNKTYLIKDNEYVRYSDDRYCKIDSIYPQVLRDRWGEYADYLLSDIKIIADYKTLGQKYSGEDYTLTEFLHSGKYGIKEPYKVLADIFDWDEEEVKWLKRKNGFLSTCGRLEVQYTIETILKMYEIFEVTSKMGTRPSELYESVWRGIYETPEDVTGVADYLYMFLGLINSKKDWAILSEQIHDEENILKRDALVPYLIHTEKSVSNTRDLYEELLIDIQMDSPARTSRIKEALACIQLYFHRYFIDFETPTVHGNEADEQVKNKLKDYWKWMKNYRVWEANRKVFLYPENYIRPELRDTKTEQFKTLEDEIMQGEMTNDLVEQAYRNYLDSYGEVSRLTVTGAYLYSDKKSDETSNDDKIIIFGRTKTDPRRYYYRLATFRDGDTDNVEWGSWIDTELQIDSEKVYPVYAFGKTFVFWPKLEIDDKEQVQNRGDVLVNQTGNDYKLNKKRKTMKVLRIYYSYQTLNNKWVIPQTLGEEIPISDTTEEVKSPAGVELRINGSEAKSSGDNIIINCSYDKLDRDMTNYNIFKTFDDVESRESKTLILTPELYTKTDTENITTFVNKGKEVFESLFVEEIQEEDTVAFNKNVQPWFVFDHKGGSFLCKPAMNNLNENVWPKDVDYSVKAAFGIGESKYLLSDQKYYKYNSEIFNGEDKQVRADETGSNSERWGIVDPAYTSQKVRAAFTIDHYTYVIKDNHYVRYEKGNISMSEIVCPKAIAELEEDLKVVLDYNGDITYDFENANIDSAFYHKEILYVVSGNTIYPINHTGDVDELLTPEFRNHFSYSTTIGAVFATGDMIMIFKHNDDTANKFYFCEYDAYMDEWINHDLVVKKDGKVVEIDACFSYGEDIYFVIGNKYMKISYMTSEIEEWSETGEFNWYHSIEMETIKSATYTNGKLYMFTNNYYMRYTINNPNAGIPEYVDLGYPRKMKDDVSIPDAIFLLNSIMYMTSGDSYTKLSNGINSIFDDEYDFKKIHSNLVNIPSEFQNSFSAALNDDTHLYIFKDNRYVKYNLKEEDDKVLPYEVTGVKYDIIRLTSSTSYKLSTKLFTDGIEKFLCKNSQEIEELPRFSPFTGDNSTIHYRRDSINEEVCPKPVKELDYNSANSVYYWELFFHIPFLIAQSLNTAQKFDEAKQWYEYVFDPAETEWWKFLPFNQHEIIVDNCTVDDCEHEINDKQIRKYLEDPFDPHAIAALRIIAYEKAIVMNYIDNIIDWGDMLFSQYTRESINEARMLYVLAYDLLGEKPESLGERILPFDRNYTTLIDGYEAIEDGEVTIVEDAKNNRDKYEFLLDLENDNNLDIVLGHLISGGTVHDSLVNPYFFIPENRFFINYWKTVEDRLFKIRHCMNIMGIKQPLPLFQPPIDPMAIVQAIGSGMSLSGAVQGLDSSVPHYRFNFMMNKAKELASKLSQFGNDLLATLEKKDAEELSILQEKQENVILSMTRNIKQAQLDEAKANTESLDASLANAKNMIDHYDGLIDKGQIPEEIAQMVMMSSGAACMTAAASAKIVNALAAILPKPVFGVFTYAKIDPVDVLDKVADASEMTGEVFNMIGEVIGLAANHKRVEQDWKLQLAMAKSEKTQLEHQIKGSKCSEVIAQHEIDILEQEIRHNESIKTFMTNKFTNKELYNWMASKLSTLYFKTYKLAHDMAKYAQKAYQFERGVKASDVNFISSMYWDSLRKGLLSGESLGYDLDRMEQAYIETNSRSLEIAKPISLLEIDPLALINLKNQGECEFNLTESLFDYDFQGHYSRQVKTVSVTFDMGEGKAPINATLTQLSHKTVMESDAKAVKYLLNPKDVQPLTIRSDWKSNQQIVLSPRGEYEENNGLFELRYDDERYLPFEGTGAVSRWRLELNGKRGSYNPSDLRDVIVNLKYTAMQGGESFADSVKGMLKPCTALHFINMAEQFSDDWEDFLSGDNELVLTFTRDMFPNMTGSKIDGIYMASELYEEGKVSMILDSGKEFKLNSGKYIETSGLNVSSNGSDWTFTMKGNKNNVKNMGLVFSYKASVM